MKRNELEQLGRFSAGMYQMLQQPGATSYQLCSNYTVEHIKLMDPYNYVNRGKTPDLGRPLFPHKTEASGLVLRHFKNGRVLFNPTTRDVTFVVPGGGSVKYTDAAGIEHDSIRKGQSINVPRQDAVFTYFE